MPLFRSLPLAHIRVTCLSIYLTIYLSIYLSIYLCLPVPPLCKLLLASSKPSPTTHGQKFSSAKPYLILTLLNRHEKGIHPLQISSSRVSRAKRPPCITAVTLLACCMVTLLACCMRASCARIYGFVLSCNRCVCMYVCVYVCMYVCMCVCVCMVCMYVCMYVCTCVYACMYVCMYVCMYALYICMYVCLNVCI